MAAYFANEIGAEYGVLSQVIIAWSRRAIIEESLYQPLGSKTRLQRKKIDGLNFGLELS